MFNGSSKCHSVDSQLSAVLLRNMALIRPLIGVACKVDFHSLWVGDTDETLKSGLSRARDHCVKLTASRSGGNEKQASRKNVVFEYK